jgi:hypothetical protein
LRIAAIAPGHQVVVAVNKAGCQLCNLRNRSARDAAVIFSKLGDFSLRSKNPTPW